MTTPQPILPERDLTTDEVAYLLRTDRSQVNRLILNLSLRATKSGRRWLVDPADLAAFKAAHANRAPDTGTRRRRKRAS